jgi:hypothetical protein
MVHATEASGSVELSRSAAFMTPNAKAHRRALFARPVQREC